MNVHGTLEGWQANLREAVLRGDPSACFALRMEHLTPAQRKELFKDNPFPTNRMRDGSLWQRSDGTWGYSG